MNWLFEANPYIVLLCGAVAVLMLLVALSNTGQRRFLALTVAAVLLTGLVLLVEWAMVTPREEVENTLYQIAADLERNDHQAIIAHISPVRTDLQARAAAQLHLVEIDTVKIARNLEISVDARQPLAEATFNARVTGDYLGLENQTQVLGFRVVFRKDDDGQWRIRDYEYDQPDL